MEIRRIVFALTVSLVVAHFATCVYAATSDNSTADKLADCKQTKDLNRTIAACSELIKTGSKDVHVYLNRGFAYLLQDDSDHAFADFETAIRLNPKEAAAFHNRGIVFQMRGDDDRAIADFNKALKLGSSDPSILVDRGRAYASQDALEKAMADYSTAIQRDSDNTFTGRQIALLLRGITYLYNGASDKALADFKQVTEINPKEPFFAIWLHVAQTRTHTASTLAAAAPNLQTTQSSLPFVRLFLGEETPEALLDFARSNAGTKRHGMCDADFYVAEFKYLQNQRDVAIHFYKAAQQDCGRNFLEWMAANAALRSLGDVN